MKQFKKARLKDGTSFMHLCRVLLGLSEAKLNENIFTEPHIRKFISGAEFDSRMNAQQREAKESFK